MVLGRYNFTATASSIGREFPPQATLHIHLRREDNVFSIQKYCRYKKREYFSAVLPEIRFVYGV